MKDKLLRLGRAMLLETFFNADIDDEPDAPPLNYAALRTNRYLYAKFGSGEQELYDLQADPLELQSATTTRLSPRPRRGSMRYSAGSQAAGGSAVGSRPRRS